MWPCTKDSCSFALCTSSSWPLSASPRPTHETDLPTYLPLVPASDCSNLSIRISPLWELIKGMVKGVAPLLVSLATDEPTLRSIVPITSPSSWKGKFLLYAACYLPHTLRCRSRTLLQTHKILHPSNHWCLCCCLWALSLVLRLRFLKVQPRGVYVWLNEEMERYLAFSHR